jgi:hypothetical protein
MIGSLMYLMNTRPNIRFAVNTLSQHMVVSRCVRLIATKHVMRYLKGTIDYGLRYVSDHEITLQGCTDSDWVGSVVDQKSTSGCCFSLGAVMISWFSRKKMSMVLSMAKAKYIAACSASSEALWPQKLLSGLFDLESEVSCIWCDNQSYVELIENSMFSKHIEIRYHYIIDMVQMGAVKLQYFATDE